MRGYITLLRTTVFERTTLELLGKKTYLGHPKSLLTPAFPTLPANSCSLNCSCWNFGWEVSTGKQKSWWPASSCGGTEQTEAMVQTVTRQPCGGRIWSGYHLSRLIKGSMLALRMVVPRDSRTFKKCG